MSWEKDRRNTERKGEKSLREREKWEKRWIGEGLGGRGRFEVEKEKETKRSGVEEESMRSKSNHIMRP